MKVPCKDCLNREITCHAKCDKYMEYAEWRRRILEKRQERLAAEAAIDNRKRRRIK